MLVVLHKIKTIPQHPVWQQLHDVRVVGLVVFGILALLVSWKSVEAIQTNFELQKQVVRLQQENAVRKLANTNLKLRNQYLNTDQFLELAARRQFGKAASGEKVIIVPKSVALAHTVSLTEPGAETPQPSLQKSRRQRNFQAWMSFFLHRPQ